MEMGGIWRLQQQKVLENLRGSSYTPPTPPAGAGGKSVLIVHAGCDRGFSGSWPAASCGRCDEEFSFEVTIQTVGSCFNMFVYMLRNKYVEFNNLEILLSR